jgi:hypothetical protein
VQCAGWRAATTPTGSPLYREVALNRLGSHLRETLRQHTDDARATEVLVVAPALSSRLRFWVSDVDPAPPDKKYDVEITPQGDQKLKVMGYAGMKFLSETMIWTRANPDLKKCGSDVARAPDPAPAPGPAPAPDQRDPPRADDPAPAQSPARAPEETKPAAKGDKSASSGKKKDCKFDIPYVNATITVPCD